MFLIDWPEPSGLVMIEAMACGTPVLAFRQGSVAEIIDQGVTGRGPNMPMPLMVPCGIFRAATSVVPSSGGGSCIREISRGASDSAPRAMTHRIEVTGELARGPATRLKRPLLAEFGFALDRGLQRLKGIFEYTRQAGLFFSDQVGTDCAGGRAVRWDGWLPRRPGGGAAPLE